VTLVPQKLKKPTSSLTRKRERERQTERERESVGGLSYDNG